MTHPPLPKYRKGSQTKKARSRSQTKAELVWGINPVLEALKSCPHAVKEIIVEKEKPGHRLEQVLELAKEKSIPVSISADRSTRKSRKPDGLAEQESTQGVRARIILPIVELDTLLADLEDISGPPLLLALDSIQDPHNLGAIIRSAVAAGVNGIILPKDRSASITGAVIKVSAGSVFHIDICQVTNLVKSFKMLKEKGIWVFGMTKDTSQLIYDTDLTVPACLVIGSEGKGLRPLVAQECDLKISIPMHGSLDSLNASVATGIVLFETIRQRRVQLS